MLQNLKNYHRQQVGALLSGVTATTLGLKWFEEEEVSQSLGGTDSSSPLQHPGMQQGDGEKPLVLHHLVPSGWEKHRENCARPGSLQPFPSLTHTTCCPRPSNPSCIPTQITSIAFSPQLVYSLISRSFPRSLSDQRWFTPNRFQGIGKAVSKREWLSLIHCCDLSWILQTPHTQNCLPDCQKARPVYTWHSIKILVCQDWITVMQSLLFKNNR